MRCFISVDVDRSLINRISEMQGMIKKLDVDVKFVEPENLHFTINFLGEVNEYEISKIRKSLDFLKYEHEFKINVSGVGHFGGNHVRTLWLGVKGGEDELRKLMKSVNDSVNFGEKISSPHLTIGRVKSSKNNEALLRFMTEFKNVNIGEMDVKTVKLKNSTITRKGPVYTDLSVFNLGK